MSVGPETVSAIFSPRAPWNLCWRMSNRRASSSGGGRFGSSRGNQKRGAVIGVDSRASIPPPHPAARGRRSVRDEPLEDDGRFPRILHDLAELRRLVGAGREAAGAEDQVGGGCGSRDGGQRRQ